VLCSDLNRLTIFFRKKLYIGDPFGFRHSQCFAFFL
jgi:hypothetical protein